MEIVCLDLEGVLVPEIWINVALKTGIEELKKTTRDIPDYHELMRGRLDILKENSLTMPLIEEVIASLDPLPGAAPFLQALRSRYQVVILSDTFYEFARPLMEKLELPTLFCHHLEVGSDGVVKNYHLRQEDQKRKAVASFKNLNFKVIAAGDSYNDVTMLKEAHQGVLFSPPQNVIDEFPEFPVANDYDMLRSEIDKAAKVI